MFSPTIKFVYNLFLASWFEAQLLALRLYARVGVRSNLRFKGLVAVAGGFPSRSGGSLRDELLAVA